MKVHVVREQFSHNGRDYPRGTEITDAAVLEELKKTHLARHLIQRHHEADAPASKVQEPEKAQKA